MSGSPEQEGEHAVDMPKSVHTLLNKISVRFFQMYLREHRAILVWATADRSRQHDLGDENGEGVPVRAWTPRT